MAAPPCAFILLVGAAATELAIAMHNGPREDIDRTYGALGELIQTGGRSQMGRTQFGVSGRPHCEGRADNRDTRIRPRLML